MTTKTANTIGVERADRAVGAARAADADRASDAARAADADRAADAGRAATTLTTTGVLVALLGLFMAVADFFIVNVALPDIATNLRADEASLQLVVAGYGMAYAALLVVGGRLGDTRGRRLLFTRGVALFTIASAVCGAAPTPLILIAARVAQGAAAATFVPQVLATIHASLSGEARLRALAWYGGALGSAAVIGQLVGGALVQLDIAGLGWRPVFLVNVPIGIATVLLGRRLLPESRNEDASAPDVLGAILLGAALLAILIPSTLGRELGWPAWAFALLPIAPVALWLLVRHGKRLERAGREPLLPSSLVSLPSVRASLAVVVAMFLAAGSFFLSTALSLQAGLGQGPLEAGITFAPYALAFLVASLNAKRMTDVFGARTVAIGGLLFAAGMAGLAVQAWMGFRSESTLALAPAMALGGAGHGLVVAPLFGIALADVPGRRAGTASGLLTTVIQACLAVGAAVLGTLFLAILGPAGLHAGTAAFSKAATVVTAIQALLGIGVAGLALTLPDPARSAGDEEPTRRGQDEPVALAE